MTPSGKYNCTSAQRCAESDIRVGQHALTMARPLFLPMDDLAFHLDYLAIGFLTA
jgi:hypothetical protein